MENTPRGEVISLALAWRLAQAWYHDRLNPFWHRKTPDETRQVFADLGLTSEFWKL